MPQADLYLFQFFWGLRGSKFLFRILRLCCFTFEFQGWEARKRFKEERGGSVHGDVLSVQKWPLTCLSQPHEMTGWAHILSEFNEIYRLVQASQMQRVRFFLFCLKDPDGVAFYSAAIKNAGLLQLFIILSVSAADCEQGAFRCTRERTAETSFWKEKISADAVN